MLESPAPMTCFIGLPLLASYRLCYSIVEPNLHRPLIGSLIYLLFKMETKCAKCGMAHILNCVRCVSCSMSSNEHPPMSLISSRRICWDFPVLDHNFKADGLNRKKTKLEWCRKEGEKKYKICRGLRAQYVMSVCSTV